MKISSIVCLYYLSTLSSNSPGQLNVFWHDCYSLCVDGAQICVFKETDQVSFTGFLKSADGCTLEPEICLEILCDFTYKTLEWQFTDQQFSGLLVTSDFTKSDCTGPVSVGLLNTSRGRGALTRGLCGQLLTWCLSTSGLPSCLLSTGHCSGKTLVREVEIVRFFPVSFSQ